MQFSLSTDIIKKRHVKERKKEMEFKDYTYLGDSTCSSIICSHGLKCRIDENGSPRCYCPDNCNEYVHRISSEGPVCGTDNRTYENVCELNKGACRTGDNLTVAYIGECGLLIFLPWKT